MSLENHRANWYLLWMLELGIISNEYRRKYAKKVKKQNGEQRKRKEPVSHNGRLIISRKNSVIGE